MSEPLVDRPHVPGYGIPKSRNGTLPWSWARERLERAIVYRLATTGSDGAPHLIPIRAPAAQGLRLVIVSEGHDPLPVLGSDPATTLRSSGGPPLRVVR